jgi:hypothetical protein
VALARAAVIRRVDVAVRAALEASGAFAKGLTPETVSALGSETASQAARRAKVSIEALVSDSNLRGVDATAATAAIAAAKRSVPDRLVYDTILETVRETLPSFPATAALASSLGGLAGARLAETVASRARAALAPERGLETAASGSRGKDPSEDSEDAADDGEISLDGIVREDARASDDLGWYAVEAVERAVAKRLAETIFDELLADTALSLAGVQ